ncbi:Zinc finger protein constans-like [Thalictrum thalictroides]|uniref:Zinc finger protein constans-like n=1 Tax=Thalictrum thalictroides TaxID=46969 RepID=A0A7J6X021_THATH|nr:Zinc finger protein constans-like [Thalictrum thalictroides]
MVNSKTPQTEKNEEKNTTHQHKKRLCDFCGESKALLYCRADSAKLCFNCDKQVHSTNQLFTKHTRSQLCDFCDSNPASILCSTENLILCQNCDWDSHGKSSSSSSSVHNRRSIEGFTGCPSGVELCSIFGIEDVKDKPFMNCGGYLEESDLYATPPDVDVNGFSDFLVWETSPIFSIDDLIGSNDSKHSFQAIGVPPLPKNRNTTCGKYKEEILSQLRDMVKLENCFIDDGEDLESLLGFQPLVPELNSQPGIVCRSSDHFVEPILFSVTEESDNKWERSSSDMAVQVPLPSAGSRSYAETKSLVIDKSIDLVDDGTDANGEHDSYLQHPVIVETSCIVPKVALHKPISQNRDSLISRYKEKKKTRRYDHHIRYESRKARAEGRSRIRGRFAKVEH